MPKFEVKLMRTVTEYQRVVVDSESSDPEDVFMNAKDEAFNAGSAGWRFSCSTDVMWTDIREVE